MSRPRQFFRVVTNRSGVRMVQGQLWEATNPGDRKPPRRYLCTEKEADYKRTKKGFKKRTTEERASFIQSLFRQELSRYKVVHQPKRGPMLSEVTRKWLEYIKITKAPRTLKSYQRTVDLYLSSVGDYRMEDWDDDRGLKFFRELQTLNLQVSTQHKHLRQIQFFLRWAHEKKLLSYKPTTPKPRQTKCEPRVYNIEAAQLIESLINEAIKTTNHPFRKLMVKNHLRAWKMLKYTGFRASEITSLTLNNIHLSEGYIQIADNLEVNFRIKNRRESKIPIADGLRPFLAEDIATRCSAELYYLDRGNGKPAYATGESLSHALRKYKNKAGIGAEVKTIHGLRGGVATWLSQKGVPLPLIQKILRHSDVSTTRRYIDAEQLDVQAALDLLPKDNIKTTKK